MNTHHKMQLNLTLPYKILTENSAAKNSKRFSQILPTNSSRYQILGCQKLVVTLPDLAEKLAEISKSLWPKIRR